MKRLILVSLIVTIAIVVLSCKAPSRVAPAKSLFNGRDLTGWHVDVPEMDKDPNAVNPFIVRNGMLVSLGTPNGHLITDEAYQNYRLRCSTALLQSLEIVVCWCMPRNPVRCTVCFRNLLKCK